MSGIASVSLQLMMPKPGTVHLVDGSGYIFRAFFALPHLSNSRGMPTNAVYGVARMLLKLVKDTHPTHLGIVFDAPTRTFRDDISESYKANRPVTPQDLQVQIPLIYRLVDALRIHRTILDGYEADDVIGTLAKRAVEAGFDVVIITGDKDFMQLAGQRITLWDTMRDRRIGPNDVRARFGVDPAALTDIMALSGDAVDNVKGVPGIGEKTASALIRKFGSLDALMASLDRLESSGIKGAKRLASLISAHHAEVEVARRLVKIDTNAPVAESIEALAYKGHDLDAVLALLRELEFDTLRMELTPARSEPQPRPAVEVLVRSERIEPIARELRAARRINLHIVSSDGGEMLKLNAEGGERVFAIPGACIAKLASLLESAAPAKACHDLKLHLRRMKRHGVTIQGIDFDSMLAGFLINSARPEPSLDDLAREHLGAAPETQSSQQSEPITVSALHRVLGARLKSDGLEQLYSEVEMPLVAVLAEMEETGIRADDGALRALSAEFAGRLAELERQCFELAGRHFNLNSPLQLREILFDVLKLPTKGLKKNKSGFSTDVDALTKLTAIHELPTRLLEYRGLAKLKSTYVDALSNQIDPATGRVHTCFHQALTATGRLSSSDPNLQNIPARSPEGLRVRQVFVAEPGWVLLSADYSQIELRVLAHLSNDRTLIEAFQRDEDIHARTAAEILGGSPQALDSESRRLAKVINFGIIYGMGPQRLSEELNIPRTQASDYIKRYFERLPGVRAYMDRVLAEARERGFVTTLLGRRRYLPELASAQDGIRAQAERIAINTPIQGTAADLIKIAMVRLRDSIRANGLKARMLLQVHDEVLFEVERKKLETLGKIARSTMETAAILNVPLKVELKWGANWTDTSTLT